MNPWKKNRDLTGIKQKIVVDLDIFSGRPNPSWELSEDETSELSKLMKNLAPASEQLETFGLGYRGFIISNPGMIRELPVQIRVCNGILTIIEKTTINHYNDVNNIEGWLIGIACERGYGNIINEALIKSKMHGKI